MRILPEYCFTARKTKPLRPSLFINDGEKFKELFPDLYVDVYKNTDGLPEIVSYHERLWCYVNEITTYPLCPICKKPIIEFYSFADKTYAGYKAFCSKKCGKISHSRSTAQTNLERYGATTGIQSKEGQLHTKTFYMKKFSVSDVSKLESTKLKIKKTKEEKYGKEGGREITLRANKTKSEIYGPDGAKILAKKSQETYFKKTGFMSAFTKERKQIEETMLAKHGEKYPSRVPFIKNKMKMKRKATNGDIFNKGLSKRKLKLNNSYEEFIHNDELTINCERCGRQFTVHGFNVRYINCECTYITHGTSIQERELITFLKQHNLNVQERQKLIHPQELDIYLPDYNLAIEYDGIYWHSTGFKDAKYHLNKTNLCKEKGIKLLHVFESEGKESEDIVKSIILAKLGKFEQRIPARKCKVIQLDNKTYREFLEQNHIQGYVSANLKFGLEYIGQIVAIMSFNSSRFKTGETELLRYCSLLNTQVIGGFSKLLKAPQLNNIVTYCDLRYSDGSGYVKNGFKIVGQSSPNYWYFRNNGRDYIGLESRMKYQKHKLLKLLENFNPNKTEVENMINHGYLRIFDCGNLKLQGSSNK